MRLRLASDGERSASSILDPTARTRLISRWRQAWPRTLGKYLWIAIVDPGAFVTEPKMLRTI